MNKLLGNVLAIMLVATALDGYGGEMPLSSFTSLVMDKSPSTWDIFAQNELQLYYTRITGRKLAVTQGNGNPGAGQIYLGATALKSGLLNGEKLKGLSADGFLAVSDGSRVAILGGGGAAGSGKGAGLGGAGHGGHQ